jgi:hypothetical protein
VGVVYTRIFWGGWRGVIQRKIDILWTAELATPVLFVVKPPVETVRVRKMDNVNMNLPELIHCSYFVGENIFCKISSINKKINE